MRICNAISQKDFRAGHGGNRACRVLNPVGVPQAFLRLNVPPKARKGNGATARPYLALSIGNTPLGQVIRRDFHGHPIPRQDANEMQTHFPRDGRENLVPVLQLNTECGVRQQLLDYAIDFNAISFCHTLEFQVLLM